MLANKEDKFIYAFPSHQRLVLGGNNKKVCIVIEGLIKLKNDGNETTVGPGGYFYSTAEAYALKNSKVLALDPEQLKKEHPELAARILGELEKREKDAAAAAPKPRNELIYEKTANCPVCGGSFLTLNVFDYKLTLIKQDPDLRAHYKKIDPIYYDIWACPHCFYANFKKEFASAVDSEAKKYLLKTSIEGRRPENPDVLKEMGSREYALCSHQLALSCLRTLEAEEVKLGNIWLRLAWLNDDLDEKEEALRARKQALQHFLNAYTGKESLLLNQAQMEQLIYMIGILSWQTGNYKEAMDFLHKYLHSPGRKPRLVDFAQNCLQEMKKASKEAGSSAQDEAL
ncbi:MAG: DUF2225 domain-containing protein [Thermacetogeniaceae bacterium]